MTAIREDESGVVGSHAVIAGEVAGHLARLVGDLTRRFSELGLPASEFMAIAEGCEALRAAAAIATSAVGSAEVTGKSTEINIDAWLSTKQVAEASGKSERWIRMLRKDGRLQGVETPAGLLFPPSAPESVRTLRRAS